MMTKIHEDDEFLRIRNRIFDLKAKNLARCNRWGNIQPLKDQEAVKIDRNLLEGILDIAEESDRLKDSLFSFLRIGEYVNKEVPSIARSELDRSDDY